MITFTLFLFICSEVEDYQLTLCEKSRYENFDYDYKLPRPDRLISRGKNEKHHSENYFQDVRELKDASYKSEMSKKGNGCGTVYDPPPAIKGFGVDMGQGNGRTNNLSSGEL